MASPELGDVPMAAESMVIYEIQEGFFGHLSLPKSLKITILRPNSGFAMASQRLLKFG